jgi:hypothetical protein
VVPSDLIAPYVAKQGFRLKRMKGFEPSTFAMANREIRPATRKLARFTMLNMA